MAEPNPTDRAAHLLAPNVSALRRTNRAPGDRAPGMNHDIAKSLVVTLTQYPALLFDLAVEAGGAEQIGWHRGFGPGRRVGPFFQLDRRPATHAEDVADSTLLPIYRRAETPDAGETP